MLWSPKARFKIETWVPPPQIDWGSNPRVYKSLKKDEKVEEEEEEGEEEEEEEEEEE